MLVRTLVMLAALASGGAARTPHPYLEHRPIPDLMRILPAPPIAGSPADIDDGATFRATRVLLGTPRAAIATRDVTDDRFTIFACAIGRKLDAQTAPAVARVFARISDGNMVGRAKNGFAVRRPYLKDDLPICEPKTAHLAGNGDYPSGHASSGWSAALILAELLPGRATEILQRGRQYGESRYICGSHSKSAVEAGFMSGAVLVSSLHASPAFRTDMDAARIELARLAAVPHPVPRCAFESAAQ